jgi:PhnB protein
MKINTYLTFDGNGQQAMEFYKQCLGADMFVMKFGDAPGSLPPNCPDSAKDRLMHAALSKDGGRPFLMASDSMPGMPFQQGNNFSVIVDCQTTDEINSLFANFSEGATIMMPLQETFWSPRYGMLKDKFGIHWMFNLEQQRPVA